MSGKGRTAESSQKDTLPPRRWTEPKESWNMFVQMNAGNGALVEWVKHVQKKKNKFSL